MKRALNLTEDGTAARKYFWRWPFLAVLFLPLLAACFSFSLLASAPAFATSDLPHARYTTNPTQGPVGAVITVTGTNMSTTRFPDGTQIDLGYYNTDFSNCTAATDSQPGIVKNGAFSAWLRWPASTGAGFFEVCAAAHGSDNPFIVGTYRVLSAMPPQITLTPTTPGAGKQATITGANFLPAGTSVKLIWPAANGLPAVSLGTVSSDENGAFTQTFTVPAHAITGTYSAQAVVGSGQPPTMSASTTFHVNGITIVAMPTPTASPVATATPTATAAATTTTNHASTITQPASNGQSGNSSDNMSLLLPIVLIGLVVIAAALLTGVFVVRRQRALALAAKAAHPAWAGNGALAPGAIYQAGSQAPPGNSVSGHFTGSHQAIVPGANGNQKPIPFDPALAEAMRQAQVSLFATPRPPVGEEVPSR